MDEDQTLDAVLAGASLARFGDGEFNLALGGECITQPGSARIAASLKALLKYAARPKNLLVGIPRQAVGPKAAFWSKYNQPGVRLLLDPQHTYASAFITRPDSAPWIDRPDYWAQLKALWAGKDVTLVRGSAKSLTAEMLYDARTVREILGPAHNAYADYARIIDQVRKAGRQTVLLCLGPTATVMAAELAAIGMHAIDLGHVGMFLRKHQRGEPMTITAQEKAYDRAALARLHKAERKSVCA
jgi:hypothetical protein